MRSLILRCAAEGSVYAPQCVEREVVLAACPELPRAVIVHAQAASDVQLPRNDAGWTLGHAIDSCRLLSVTSVIPFDQCVLEFMTRTNDVPALRVAMYWQCAQPQDTLNKYKGLRVVRGDTPSLIGRDSDIARLAIGVLFCSSSTINRGSPFTIPSRMLVGWTEDGIWLGGNVVTRTPDISAGINVVMWNCALTSLVAFAFMHCKGTELKERPAADVDHKWHRRTRVPVLKEYTLHVRPGPVRRNTESGEPGEAGVMPLHLCRGHFARYTEDAPLFGKHVGQFWIPQHVRGKRENGVIKKSYMV